MSSLPGAFDSEQTTENWFRSLLSKDFRPKTEFLTGRAMKGAAQ